MDVLDDLASNADGVAIVLREELARASHRAVHVGTAQIFIECNFTRGSLEQRRPGQKHLRVLAHHDHVVAQARHVGTTSGGRAVHDCHLRNACSRKPALVGKGLAARDEQLRLVQQVRPARFDHRHHRQLLLQRDLLQAQGFLHAPGRHGAALDGAVAGDHEAAHAADVADARDHVAARQRAILVVVLLVAAEGGELQPRRAAVEHQMHAFARQ